MLIRSTWKGCTRILMWKESFPAFFVMYLLQEMREASRASLEICSFSRETKCRQFGKSSMLAFLRPRS